MKTVYLIIIVVVIVIGVVIFFVKQSARSGMTTPLVNSISQTRLPNQPTSIPSSVLPPLTSSSDLNEELNQIPTVDFLSDIDRLKKEVSGF